jgi:tight adherence protein C
MSDQMMLLIGLGGIFLGVLLLLATIGVITSERQAVGRSLAAVQAIQTAPKAMRSELDQPFRHRVFIPAMARLSGVGRTLSPDSQSERIKRRLDLAGNPPNWTVDRIFALKMLGLLLGLMGGIGLSLAFGVGALAGLGLTLVLLAIGFYAGDIVLLQISQTRQERIQRDLPDALDLLSISVEAGLGFDAALAQLARNTTGPLADEFFRVLQEMQIGTGRSDAMRGLGDRTTVPELRGFVTAMVQADAFGVPVANVLRVQAADMRVKRSQRAEEKAQKVPVKILFPLIFCILPALFIVVIGPAAITIFRNVVQGQ